MFVVLRQCAHGLINNNKTALISRFIYTYLVNFPSICCVPL